MLYSYDKVGNIVSMTYPDGSALSVTYDALNRVRNLGTFATFSYTLDDSISTINYGNNEITTYSYDSRSRPTRILVKNGATKRLDLNYSYGGTGNVLSINSETYGYDWLDRLTASSGPWGTITYTYDAVGNKITKVEGSTTTYTYGSYNRLTQAGSTTYTYDANGNLATKNDGFSWTYAYDYENRLTQVTRAGATLQQNYYDGDGKRTKSIEGSTTTLFIYQGLNIVYTKDVGSGAITDRFYANGLQIARIQGGLTYYYHQDHLGSTRLVSDGSVTTIFSTNYKPYGPLYGSSGSEGFMYTGKPYDSSTGLYYFGARYYDPSIGRFITQGSYSGEKESEVVPEKVIYSKKVRMHS